jgi:hypothetical protein
MTHATVPIGATTRSERSERYLLRSPGLDRSPIPWTLSGETKRRSAHEGRSDRYSGKVYRFEDIARAHADIEQGREVFGNRVALAGALGQPNLEERIGSGS